MRFDVVTLFPELFEPFTRIGVTRRAFDTRQLELALWQLRDFADNTYRRVDDRPFGGGPGMVMLYEPLRRAVQAAQSARAGAGLPRAHVILFSPAGPQLTQPRVEALARSGGALLICGRYEGVDQRFVDQFVDEEISLGDFVLSGGELPALALIDAVARLQPGVLNDAASHQQDSFSDGLLDCPHYSRPEILDPGVLAAPPAAGAAPSASVPAMLLSGHHAQIARWRRDAQLRVTAQRRPDLITAARAAGLLNAKDEAFLRTL